MKLVNGRRWGIELTLGGGQQVVVGGYEEKGVENCHKLGPLVNRTLLKFLSSQKALLGK